MFTPLSVRLFMVAFGLIAASSLAEEPPIPEAACRDVGGYVLNNNVWGKAKSPHGWEVIDDIHGGKSISWRARYNWPVGSDQYSVKCYPSVITGWHWDISSSDRRLPRVISSLKNVTTGATATIRNPGVQNVAYDLWFHASGKIPGKDSKPTDEVMIWMAAHGGAGPLGKLREKVRIGDADWSLYVGDVGWKVFSFVRAENCETWKIDAKLFFDHLVKTGLMTTDKQLSSVQFGTEVFQSPGEGRMDVNDYYVEIE